MDLKDRILDAALPNAAFDGWTQGMLERAAKAADASAFELKRAFPDGVMDALDHLTARTDAVMLEQLKILNLPTMKIRERIATAMMVRLRLMLPYREAIRRALTVYAMHPLAAMGTLHRTTDAMWRAAGDTATDYNYYTKRMLLGQVYTSTLSVWLDDTDDLKETEAFLRRRIENVMQFEKLKAKAKETFSGLMKQG